MTFSFRSCFSLTADERSSSSRFETCFESMARFDASKAARVSFFRLLAVNGTTYKGKGPCARPPD